MDKQTNTEDLRQILQKRPQAVAILQGSPKHPELRGTVSFRQTKNGVFILAQFHGLPRGEICTDPVFAFHIHSGNSCTGTGTDPFANALTHYNPQGCAHPYHAGDLPPIFGNDGIALSAFLTNRFSVSEIIGKTLILHSDPDDFRTQPSGNAGEKIACGIIEKR